MQQVQNLLPRIVLTMGEPAGIGPELLVRIASLSFNAQIIVLADSQLLKAVAHKLGVALTLSHIDWQSQPKLHQPNHLWIEEHSCIETVVTGQLNTANAQVALNILQRASDLALDGKAQAIVTAPVHKANLNQVDPLFLGHTEYLAKRAKVDQVVMMLATRDLKVALATTHLPLAQVPQAISQEKLATTIKIINQSFAHTKQPIKIAVSGLNPHAGEDGILGNEEVTTITPVIKALQAQKINVNGPFPADTLFTPQNRKNFDVFLAMYHDQGLPVIKALGFGECVNVTLGLPYVRTSVDHGTALDIAADFSASNESLAFALNYAIELVQG